MGVVWCGSPLKDRMTGWLGPGPEGSLLIFLSFVTFSLSTDNMVRVRCGVVYCGVVWVPTEGPGPEVRLWAWAWAWAGAPGQTFNIFVN